MIDTHAHLCDPAFSGDLPAVLERARAAGVRRVVAVGESLADARRNLELAAAHPEMVAPAAGLFPTRLDLDEADEICAWIRRHRDRLAAVGEVGLDHWKVRGGQDRELQEEILSRFVQLALEVDLPLNVHSRSAGRATIDFLLARGARRVQMHAFDGRAASALAGVEAGYFFSVPPSVVRSPQKQKLVRRLPLSCLLLETDSPVLGAEPGARNEPAQAIRALRAIAELKGLDPRALREAIAANESRLYPGLDRLTAPSAR
ncbi:MAG: TatD family hydrolase [Acidobacteriota bacterium]|nr:TatD family hydrolase [Acidobacteriota bacterium]MDH3522372.1 TatD family hydrolase [Acidobacteriota bacterium]